VNDFPEKCPDETWDDYFRRLDDELDRMRRDDARDLAIYASIVAALCCVGIIVGIWTRL